MGAAWRSIEPSDYDAARHAEFGTGVDAKRLAGIMGHNLCLDIFGGPSPEEAAAGITPHGEASVVPYDIEADRGRLFDVPTFRWLPARGTGEVEYWIVMRRDDAVPERLEWPA